MGHHGGLELEEGSGEYSRLVFRESEGPQENVEYFRVSQTLKVINNLEHQNCHLHILFLQPQYFGKKWKNLKHMNRVHKQSMGVE